MSDLVRAVVGRVETNVSRSFAEARGLEVLDEPTHKRDGTPRPASRRGGRPRKPRVSVADVVAEKKADQPAADETDETDEKSAVEE